MKENGKDFSRVTFKVGVAGTKGARVVGCQWMLEVELVPTLSKLNVEVLNPGTSKCDLFWK